MLRQACVHAHDILSLHDRLQEHVFGNALIKMNIEQDLTEVHGCSGPDQGPTHTFAAAASLSASVSFLPKVSISWSCTS